MTKMTKLHRSTKHRVLAGVLGGFAEYLGWSPTTVRVLFWAIIIFSAGVTLPMALFAYLVMWLVMPEATPASYAIEHEHRY
ncbi:PspC domain-containing protein [Moraxella bovoculi]|uniref:PspC domain-containing protein n=1 Tax=Moraxella bovoculi TaxID=386891 RepID=UPI0006245A80|nr:PspC domain-containing protein [Moraxella bovoculi]AKG15971.2 stress-responsive transcriptional regulator [Moraxella bovoculi]